MRDGPHELEIQNSPGDAVRGPFDRLDLRERVYLGLLTGEELVRPVGGRFATLRSLPDFAAILALRERGKAKATVKRRLTKESRAPGPVPEGHSDGAATAAGAAGAGDSTDDSGAEGALGQTLAVPDAKRAGTVAAVTIAVAGGLLLLGFLAYGMTL
ncbi:MAG TPA: hypothetical protein DFR83_29035 [Deltaproteobacteria bacterium]|nr:hypothetical protein [Deltaproteobacteria bacterium]